MKSSCRHSRANTWWARSRRIHSISNVSSERAAAPLIGAVRTRTRAKREHSGSPRPPRNLRAVKAHMGEGRRPHVTPAMMHAFATG
jgi:hypothetical protein